jgi:predicted ABC-type ATPase
VRIVNPLVIDSIDIFMFQKLEEKTARINTIWSNNGKSVFKIEELDPEELKYALVKDPRVIAKIESESKTTKLQDEINAMKVINDRLKNYVDAVAKIANRVEDIDNILNSFAKSKLSLDLNAKISYLVGVYKSDMPKDGDGKVMLGWYDLKYFDTDEDVKEKYKGIQISPYEQPNRPYWFNDVIESKRLIEKENRDLLKPRNIDDKKVREYIDNSENRKKEYEKEIEFLRSDTYVDKRSAEIIKKREETKFEIKPIPKLVTEFERLNYLLSIKMAKADKKKEPFKYDRKIFLDDKGVAKIDDATIKMLTEGINTLPQTKELNLDEAGNYTADRLLLHYEIINDIKRNLNCIQRDEPIAILTGGSPASGKSTFLKRYAPYLLSEELLKIDADEIRAKLPEYEGWNAAVTHSETKDIVNTLLTDKTIGVPCMFDLIYDGTMNNTRNYLPLIGLLKRLGYKVFIVYMDNVPYDVVKERMLKRYQTSGRFVPVEVIDDFYAKGKTAINELKTKVDGYMIIDATSTNYDIIEQGGMKLPNTRNYGQLGERVKTADIVDKMIEATKILIHE